MRLRRKSFAEAVNEFERLRQRVNSLEAFSAHRREQLRQYGEVVEDLQTTVRSLQTQLEHLQRTVPGRCQGCGRLTDSPDVFYCSDTCTTKVAS